MVTYDPKLIYQFADRLYKKADSVITTYTIIGIITGLITGGPIAFAGYNSYSGPSGGMVVFAIFIIFVAGIIGYAIGNERAFWIRLQAQTALCQAKIEENTLKTFELQRQMSGGAISSSDRLVTPVYSAPAPDRNPSVNRGFSAPLPQAGTREYVKTTCARCLTELKPGAIFCEDCGAKV